jgi:hypothetical protein
VFFKNGTTAKIIFFAGSPNSPISNEKIKRGSLELVAAL